ncbi:MAG: glycoside hydrolase family 127 protein [Chloroflexota bacterium]|nr:glycoside hydrolase family 127 protein [Chloroflexota bacterium]
MSARELTPLSLDRVEINGPFWGHRQAVNREVTLRAEYQHCKETGRIDAWKLDWEPGMPNPPHHFWDSDVAKWLEAVGYTLATHPDEELKARADEVIDMIAEAQQDDGYLNIHFTTVEPRNRWANLRDMHELYCAGHLMEAAVAYYEGTGDRQLLDVLCRYADYIDSVFGPGEGQKRGYPGHEEIELALVKLYRATGKARYLDLATFFIDERGRQPHYFDIEARRRGEGPGDYRFGTYDYAQAHLPVREQTTAEGHAVRAMYLYSGMADVAAETGDDSLLAACERLWENVTQRRMYVTGGVGSSSHGERFTIDYDLPNDLAYAETCAAIGLVFWAHRMLQFEGDGRYADVMERALYNGVLSGVSLKGDKFFYANPLEAIPALYEARPDLFGRDAISYTRQGWFSCACCPPNLARLIASLGQYIYSESEGGESQSDSPKEYAAHIPEGIYVHLYVGGSGTFDVDGREVVLSQETRYPWEGEVTITVQPEARVRFPLALRIPGWSRGATLQVNGQPVDVASQLERGYVKLERVWEPGDRVVLDLPMPVERVEAHPSVAEDCGRVAIQRGPLVYCLEQVDNGPNLRGIVLPADAELQATFKEGLLGGVVAIEGEAKRRDRGQWDNALYRTVPSASETVPIRAIPYYAWANREPGEMLVWIRQG